MIKKVSVSGYEFEVDFDYQPYEKATRHSPPVYELVEINDVMDSDGDIVKEYAFEYMQDDLEQVCLEAVHEDQDRVTDAQMEHADGIMEERKIRGHVFNAQQFAKDILGVQ